MLDHVNASAARRAPRAVCPEPRLEILHADDALVAIAKPSGLLVHRTGLEPRATTFAVQQLRDQLGRHVWPVHRLDRATSGVLLFALSPEVLAILAASFAAGAVAKRYLAVVRGWPPPALTIDHPLARLADEAEGPARAASTRLERLATIELPLRVDRYPTSRYALVALEPVSGRRHQLRRHLKHAGHPILGDTTYGQGRHNRHFRERFGLTRLLLHAAALRFDHPLDRQPLSIEAEPPADFARVVAACGLAAATATER
ncbi:MAG: pseudouridylate synthase [Proteobacteria bacterium]|nr:pseudouridylate synthase [Pseudomonadota bacterium]